MDTSKYTIYTEGYMIGNIFSGNGSSIAFLRVLSNGKLQACYQTINTSGTNRPLSGSFWYYTTD